MVDKQHISWKDIDEHCQRLALSVLKSGFRPDYIVGITRGGLMPALRLSHLLEVPMHTLQVSLRDGGECESNCWMSEDAVGYGAMGCLEGERKNILIVDDINDTGATYRWIRQDWQASCLPNLPEWQDVWGYNVRFAVLVNNLSSEETADYSSIEINKAEHDCWIVFPWERT